MKKYLFVGFLILAMSAGSFVVFAQDKASLEKEEAAKLPIYTPDVLPVPISDNTGAKEKQKTTTPTTYTTKTPATTRAIRAINPSTVSGPMIVNIGPDGNVLMRGKIISVDNSAGTLKVKSWGGEWDVNKTSSTQLISNNRSLSDFQAGAIVGVSGKITQDGTFEIDAKILRAWGSRSDSDNDGIPDNQDGDNDNNGKPDASETKPPVTVGGTPTQTPPTQTPPTTPPTQGTPYINRPLPTVYDTSAPYGSRTNPRLMAYTTFTATLIPGATQATADAIINNRGSNIPIRAFGLGSNGRLTVILITDAHTNNVDNPYGFLGMQQFDTYLRNNPSVVSVDTPTSQIARYYLLANNWVSEYDLDAWIVDCPRQKALNPNVGFGECPASF